MTPTLPIAGIALAILVAGHQAAAQSGTSAPVDAGAPSVASQASGVELSEQLRAQCIAERRSVCGRILRIFPDGILVESGHTNLLREPLTKSWLVPGSVVASLTPGLVESKEPGAMCMGTVFVTDLPRGKPRQYDYVILTGYPTGEFSYESVGTIHRTVRRYSVSLDKAVKTNLAAAEPPAAAK